MSEDNGKRERLLAIKAYWENKIPNTSGGKPGFYPKPIIKQVEGKNINVPHLMLFKNELSNPAGFYTEIVDFKNNIASPDRKLYFLPYNSNWEEIFPPDPSEIVKGQYDVPFSLFQEVKNVTQEVIRNLEEKEDTAWENLTGRQRACLELRVPDSGLNWLDDLIRKAI